MRKVNGLEEQKKTDKTPRSVSERNVNDGPVGKDSALLTGYFVLNGKILGEISKRLRGAK